MTYAVPNDARIRWPVGTPVPEDAILQAWLNDAELVIRARYPELDRLIEYFGTDTGDASVVATVVLVEVRVAIRGLTTPGRPVIREQIGDTSVSYQQGNVGLSLDSSDVALLDGRFGMYRWLTGPRLTDFDEAPEPVAGWAW